MNAGLAAAVVMAGLLILTSIPAGLVADEKSALHADSLVAHQFPDASYAFGPLDDLAQGQAVIIVSPVLPVTSAEARALRDLIAAGGRVVVVDGQGSGRGIVASLETDIELTGSHIYSPIQRDGQVALSPIDLWRGANLTIESPVAIRGGTPLLQTDELAWLDLNDDGLPSLNEPRAAWSIAAYSDGLLVIGADGLTDPGLATLVAEWVDGFEVVVDERHRRQVDPLGMADVLAGAPRASSFAALVIATTVIVLLAYQPRMVRRVPKRRAISSHQLLEELQ